MIPSSVGWMVKQTAEISSPCVGEVWVKWSGSGFIYPPTPQPWNIPLWPEKGSFVHHLFWPSPVIILDTHLAVDNFSLSRNLPVSTEAKLVLFLGVVGPLIPHWWPFFLTGQSWKVSWPGLTLSHGCLELPSSVSSSSCLIFLELVSIVRLL